jgi:hypothetical protein
MGASSKVCRPVFMSANEGVFLVLQQQLNLAFPNGRQPVALAHYHGHVKAPAFPKTMGDHLDSMRKRQPRFPRQIAFESPSTVILGTSQLR